MATDTQKPLGQSLVSVVGTPTVLYTAPASPENRMARIEALNICNTDTVAHAITIRTGVGALTAANSIFDAAPIPANTTWICSPQGYAFLVAAGGTIQAFADVAAKVSVSVYGSEVTG